MRFYPNPYYIPELKKKTGNDFEVYDYVMKSEQAKEFDEKLFDMIKFLVPNYITEGKNQLVIGIGCTEESIVRYHLQMHLQSICRNFHTVLKLSTGI